LRITFPHMGSLWIPVKCMLEYLGVEVVVAPPVTRETVTLGVKHSPEFACFPLKVNMGNFMQAYELGADTILMAGGVGPCRFGYYAQVEREILRDLGYDYEMVVLEPPKGHVSELLERARKVTGYRPWTAVYRAVQLAWHKFCAIDDLERETFRVRPRERRRGTTTHVFRRCLEWIDEAITPEEISEARERSMAALRRIPVREVHDPIRVGIVGEIFMVLEPFVNLRVAERLGDLGVEVDRSIMLSDWIRSHLFLDALRLNKRPDPVKRAAARYLDHFVGGEGLESIGNVVLYAQKGFDGVVHIMPFTCMPEIVAQSIMPKVSAEQGIPVLTLILDEHTAEAGVVTRLEAFVDLLARRRAAGRAAG